MNADATLQLLHVCTGHRRRGHPRLVSLDLDLCLHGGTLTALLGPNGAGKSTLLATMAGTLRPLAGQVLLGGRDAARMDARELSRQVSVVLTTVPPGAGALTAREAVALGRLPYTGPMGRLRDADRRAVQQAIDRLGLQPLAERRLADMSDGERQKVMMARAVAQATPIILLDEPTSFLDFPSQLAVFGLMRRLAHEEGKTVVVSTHALGLALQSADRLAVLSTDRRMVAGTPHELARGGQLDVFFPPALGVHFDRRTLTYTLTAPAAGQSFKEQEHT